MAKMGLTWLRFLEKSAARLLALPRAFLEAAGELDDLSMEALLACPESVAVSAHDLRVVARWRRVFATLEEALSRLPESIPEALLPDVYTRDRASALHRVGRLLSMASTPAPVEAWRAGLQIWVAAAGIARKEAVWSCEVLSSEHPRFSHYGDLLQRKESLEELPGHRWLAGCQAEEEGVLQMRWEIPSASMLPQVALYRSDLGEAAKERSRESLLQELATDDLPGWLRRWAHEAATQHAIDAAVTSYRELLLQAPLRVSSLAAVYVGGEQSHAAVAWLDAEGQLEEQAHIGRIERGGKVDIHRMAQAIHKALRQRKPAAVVLPLRAANRGLLQLLVKVLHDDFPIHRVREAGLSDAREPYTQHPHNHRREVAAALVLGLRVHQPRSAWAAQDPLRLGLAEYQEHIDPQRLREALEDERVLVEAERVKPAPSQQAQAPQEGRLNPLVKSLSDLRPGLSLAGIVANITDFGAFVNVGLPEEGLVHKSELADRFVSHPSEVVRVGQRVQVRVLSVDTKQARISLSMRSAMRPRPRSSSQRKAQALRDLDNLFKK